MKNWGCAVASTAMVLKYYGKDVNPKILASFKACPRGGCYDCLACDEMEKFFTSCGCICWSKVAWYYLGTPEAFHLASVSLLDSELKKHPVIAKTSSAQVPSHFVVIVDKDEKDYIVLDPYEGFVKDEKGNLIKVGGCVYLHQSLAYAASGGKGQITGLRIFEPQ